MAQGSKNLKELKPSEICYMHDDVSKDFKDGRHNLRGTFKELNEGRIKPEDLGPIEVVKRDDGKYAALHGNRRLLLLQTLEEGGKIDTITVKEKTNPNKAEVAMRNTTTTGGESITVRGDPTLQQDLRDMMK